MDKSFQGLVLSLVVHAILVVLLLNTDASDFLPQTDTTVVEFIEKPQIKAKGFVTETEKAEKADLNLKRTADYLSQYTKRVEKETKARNNGPTQNSLATPTMQSQSESRQASSGNRNLEEGVGKPGQSQGMGGAGLNPALHNVAIGQSSLAEYIPGVQEGAFTALNTDQFTYYTFFARVNEQVRPRWITLVRNFIGSQSVPALENLARIERRTLIEVVIDKEGEYVSGVVLNTSGERALDQTSVEAFRRAAPFLNPPKGLVEQDGRIRLRYGFVVEFRPPSLGGASPN